MDRVTIEIIFPENNVNLDELAILDELKEILIKLAYSMDDYKLVNGNFNQTYLGTKCIIKVE